MWDNVAYKLEHHLLSFGTAVVVCSWLVSLGGAAVAYVAQSEEPAKSLRGFLRFCCPPELLRHPSCRLDYVYVGINQLIPGAVMVPFMISSVAVALLSYQGLTLAFGAHTQAAEPTWLWLVLLLGTAIVQDFMVFYIHYLQHQTVVLWELHKVHHSAEFLMPITNRRFHPLQAIADNTASMLGVGLFVGLASYVFSLPVEVNSIAGLDSLFVINMLSFYHLRHSHVALRYGWLERHMMSPAQHQLHHSREERHWDKNFGLCFAWWDRAFGTIVYSSPNDRFSLGLPLDIQHDYDTTWKLFATPVRNLARLAWRAGRRAVPVPPAAARQATGETGGQKSWSNVADLTPTP